MSMKLYFHPASTCSQKVRIALAEKGFSYEMRVMDFTKLEQLEDWYLEINPNGVVPTLVHDGASIMDSSVICEYLDEIRTEPPLTSNDPVERARMRAWMRYFEEVPTSAIRIPSFHLYLGRVIRNAHSEEQYEAMVRKTPLRKQLYRSVTSEGVSEAAFADSLDRLRQCLQRLASALCDGRCFIMGDQFTIADIVLIPSVVRMVDLDLGHLWNDLPEISRWLDRVEERPSFAEAYPPEARVNPNAYQLSQGNA